MARGFNYAPGASPEVAEASADAITRERLVELGASHNKMVREIVAARADCPLGLLVTFAHDHVVSVRVAVASNPIALRSVMAYLSADRAIEVVEALIGNPSLPPEILNEIAFHRKGRVRDVAAIRLNAVGEGAGRSDEDAHTPELRDRAFEQPSLRLVNSANPAPVNAPVQEPPTAIGTASSWSPQGSPLAVAPAASPAFDVAPAAASAAPTRTAPVRGFKPPATTP